MICIKVTAMKRMPQTCDDCVWYSTYPDTFTGFSEVCEYAHQRIDDSGPEEWLYDGNNRPKMCPLIEVEENGGREDG